VIIHLHEAKNQSLNTNSTFGYVFGKSDKKIKKKPEWGKTLVYREKDFFEELCIYFKTIYYISISYK
jgi:hypothetical protein